MTTRSAALFCLLAAFFPRRGAIAADAPRPIACRSVHLRYDAPEGRTFYNELTVRQSAPGTFFVACGFADGYFGIQELADGKKVALFSVWDPGKQDEPRSVPEERRVKVLATGNGTRVGRFGGEGTGAQCFLDADWKIGQTCQFLIESKPDRTRTAYAAHFRIAGAKQWSHLATFSTPSAKGLRDYYAFVEDFCRDGDSAKRARRAEFSNGWVRSRDGKWIALTRAQFTGDSTPSVNIDAAANAGRFALATGGDTVNAHARLDEWIDCPPAALNDLPGD